MVAGLGTWTCHSCGEERPDSRISVMLKVTYVRGIEIQINRRYCNDRELCRITAGRDILCIEAEMPGFEIDFDQEEVELCWRCHGVHYHWWQRLRCFLYPPSHKGVG